MFSGTRIANARHHVNFRQNRSNGCRDIAIFRFSKMTAAAILDFQKFKFLTARTFERPNLRYCAKFHQDRSIRCWDMAIFLFFKMADVRHVGFLKLQFWIFCVIRSANARHHVKFVKIGQTVAEILRFYRFPNGFRRHLGFSKIQILNGWHIFDTKSALLC